MSVNNTKNASASASAASAGTAFYSSSSLSLSSTHALKAHNTKEKQKHADTKIEDLDSKNKKNDFDYVGYSASRCDKLDEEKEMRKRDGIFAFAKNTSTSINNVDRRKMYLKEFAGKNLATFLVDAVRDILKKYKYVVCCYCLWKIPETSIVAASWDRIDNKHGHCVDNVVLCCRYCNKNRNDTSVEKFLRKQLEFNETNNMTIPHHYYVYENDTPQRPLNIMQLLERLLGDKMEMHPNKKPVTKRTFMKYCIPESMRKQRPSKPQMKNAFREIFKVASAMPFSDERLRILKIVEEIVGVKQPKSIPKQLSIVWKPKVSLQKIILKKRKNITEDVPSPKKYKIEEKLQDDSNAVNDNKMRDA